MTLYYMPKFLDRHPVLSQDDLIPLNNINNLSEKMQKLSQLLEIPAEEFNARRSSCAELRELLRKYYPDCLLLMFGSSVNGFGFKGCDLDLLFLPFPGYCNLEFSSQEKPAIPEPSSILTGEISRDILSKLDEFSQLKFIRTVLRQEKTQVKKVIFIPAKSPILKVYLTNKIVCDLSASNRLIVFNSELLQFFEKLDVRVKPLITTLRFWARSLGFIKRSFFSSYAFTLLVIFFLQNVSPQILPSVESLVKNSGFSRMTAGWQTAFSTDEKSIQPSKNTSTVGELLMEFFQYYWNFDFVQNVVSTYTGKIIPVTELKNIKDERMIDFEVSSINIQDPFILNRNVCKKEGPRNVFKLCLITAYDMLENKNEKFKFNMLFDVKEYQKVLDLHYDKYMFGAPKVCFINFDHACIANLKKNEGNSFLWYKKVSDTVYDVLQHGLLIECEVTDTVLWNCQKPPEHQMNDIKMKQGGVASQMNGKPNLKSQSNPYDLELLKSIQCILYTRTWIGRKNVTQTTMNGDEKDEFPSAVLNAEYHISNELVRKNPAISSPVPLLCFACDCYKHSCSQIAGLVIMLKPLTFSREFHQVSAFLASYIPKTVKKILASD